MMVMMTMMTWVKREGWVRWKVHRVFDVAPASEQRRMVSAVVAFSLYLNIISLLCWQVSHFHVVAEEWKLFLHGNICF